MKETAKKHLKEGVHPHLAEIEAFNGLSMDFRIATDNRFATKTLEGKRGWDDEKACSTEYLFHKLREAVDRRKMVDVAIWAMMIWNRHAENK